MRLYNYQGDCLTKIDYFNRRIGLFLDPGLGKTIIVLEWLLEHPNELPAIILCPASVKWHWQYEANQLFGMSLNICSGKKKKEIIGGDSTTWVANYDILNSWVTYFKDIKPKTVVIDECQYIANHKSIRTKATKELCKGVPNVIALSGTPILNRPIELFSTLNLLRPRLFPSRWNYAKRYCNLKKTYWGWDFNGSSNLKELHEVLVNSCVVRKKKSVVLPDLPPKTISVIPLPIKNPAEYAKANHNFLKWLEGKDKDKAKRARRAESFVKVEYLKQLAAKLKLYYVIKWINELLEKTDEKLIIFASHRKMIEALERRCKAKSVVLYGKTKGSDRQAIINQFQNDSETRSFIANTKSAGVGTKLTAANIVAFTELEWQSAIHNQAADRPHRIGQTKPVFVYYLIAHGTIEEHLCRIIQRKQRIISTVLDGESNEDDLSIFDELMKSLKSGD